ncbi:hypothetical protein [Parasphingorhabdus halotolerans]|uniref:Uncharacterized protein n=1 Tax=Parasphingorhabdus halotolerans TaxID=2725558 RepID=A0A6H2DLD4_9SPHN|nr:hypothetical protein [Parasphingorhabdus halotolerans]QJB68561.1 hypothetical protein HF685_04060 [Parasphingorhabdus halotolerans]
MNPIKIAEQLVSVRKHRNEVLGPEVAALGEYGWIILLELFVYYKADKELSLSRLFANNDIPKSTGMRTIKCLLDCGILKEKFMFENEDNLSVELSSEAASKMNVVLRVALQSTSFT